MSGDFSASGSGLNTGVAPNKVEWPNRMAMLRAGVAGGLIGAVIIWIYEALIWVGAQHLMPLAGIPRNATGLVFGKEVQESLGVWAYIVGTGIHFVFASAWGVLFAAIWPYFRRRGYEATFVALFYAVVAWIAMHVAIMIASDNHPNYYDPAVIIGGFMSHIFFTVPLALTVKRLLQPKGQ
ncbi:hypothetical protein [Paraburkholderia haematera]|uniref:DUF1440 domain-containing protein n=1 Tax=Paraburkholderia haematera TaxID=2793077 RepID=A0ABN7MQ90_9BURK|nr:hypothetical protein [Paraburkholderia haematera]CAE6808330.1 hypothetical protein R69888_05540 [Paraburkholderia haematera]